MESLTILMADLPKLLEDVLGHLLVARPEVALISGSVQGSGVADAALAVGADVVVVTSRDPTDLAALDGQLARLASLSVLALNADGAWACVHSLHPSMTRIDDISGAQLVSALTLGASERKT
jgi:hypothetical protein